MSWRKECAANCSGKNRMDSKGRRWVEYGYTSGARPFLTGLRATPGVANRKARLPPGFSHLLTLSVVMSMLPYHLPHLSDHVEGSSGDARNDREGFQDFKDKVHVHGLYLLVRGGAARIRTPLVWWRFQHPPSSPQPRYFGQLWRNGPRVAMLVKAARRGVRSWHDVEKESMCGPGTDGFGPACAVERSPCL